MPARRLDRRHIFVKRYKTTMCNTFVSQGSCPYHHECLFAHDVSELRTEEMNIKECVTGELITQWVAEKKRNDTTSDCSLPMSNRSDSAASTTDSFFTVPQQLLEKPSSIEARRAISLLWRGANKHVAAPPPKPHSRRRARHRAVVAAPTRNPYATLEADDYVTILVDEEFYSSQVVCC